MPMQGVRFARSAIATAVMAATVPAAASAATFEVTTKQDRAGACDANCALREAVLAAGETAADDVIILRKGTYALTREGSDEDGGLTGDLDVAQETSTMVSSGALDIRGRSVKTTRIDANGIDRALHLLDDAPGAGPPVELRGSRSAAAGWTGMTAGASGSRTRGPSP
jgi:hypothetical protein